MCPVTGNLKGSNNDHGAAQAKEGVNTERLAKFDLTCQRMRAGMLVTK